MKLKVRIDSADDAELSAKVATSIGSRTFAGILDGETRVAVQHAKGGATADGSLTVDVAGPDGTLELVESYAVPTCG